MELPVSQVELRHRNPNTSMDLVIPIDIICNTPDEVLISNITENSKTQDHWLCASDPHDRIAVICGSGPSIADDMEEIRKWEGKATIYALNGCAKFLADNGIIPDYQVICDARAGNTELIGPAHHHLFASQCDPEMFRKVDAILWHLQIGEIERFFPDYQKPYVLIGGAASVGNTATCLAYAMGYRTLHLYGYDSCHKEGKGHAFHQKLNEGDPTLWTEFNGKKYLASFTMKHQAEKFMDTARALRQMGTEIHVHGYGLLPDMWNQPKAEMEEQDKYSKMWTFDGYRQVSPGELIADKFIEIVKPARGARIADFGCGTGRGGLAISKMVDCRMTLLDFTENSRDEAAMDLPFIKSDLTKFSLPLFVNHGFCADVLEHIPTDKVDDVINNIMDSCEDCFFQISTVPDVAGVAIGQDLHLTVKPYEWWKNKFLSLGYTVLWGEKSSDTVNFHISYTGENE